MRRFRVETKDGETAGIAFGDPVRPVEVLFLHATGFNAIAYQSLLEPLGGQMHVAAIDIRGHGRTKLPANPRRLRSWNKFRDDVIQVLESVAPKGAVLGGHSMGGTVSLLVAAKRPDLVRGLMLADPVLMKKSIYRTYNTPLLNLTIGRNAMSKAALRPIVRFSSGVL
jgi:pimeloyl-ACP methyl ester carboxylesterase